jgi:hypothetical protein
MNQTSSSPIIDFYEFARTYFIPFTSFCSFILNICYLILLRSLHRKQTRYHLIFAKVFLISLINLIYVGFNNWYSAYSTNIVYGSYFFQALIRYERFCFFNDYKNNLFSKVNVKCLLFCCFLFSAVLWSPDYACYSIKYSTSNDHYYILVLPFYSTQFYKFYQIIAIGICYFLANFSLLLLNIKNWSIYKSTQPRNESNDRSIFRNGIEFKTATKAEMNFCKMTMISLNFYIVYQSLNFCRLLFRSIFSFTESLQNYLLIFVVQFFILISILDLVVYFMIDKRITKSLIELFKKK